MNSSSHPSKVSFLIFLIILVNCLSPAESSGQQRRPPAGGRIAVVVDERLSALRATPDFSGKLLRRVGRGKLVAVRKEKRTADGVVFYQVNVTRRTGGWLQRESVVLPGHAADERRLARLISASEDFDRIIRAQIFFDLFPRSALRPTVLLLYGDEADKAAAKLARDAARRLDPDEIKANSAPLFSYYLNYNGLDRYRRQGIVFRFDSVTRQFHYDGAAWREIVRRYPRSSEAAEARQRLEHRN